MKKTHSGKYNLLMSYILQAANFLFPLITYPYITRMLGSVSLGRISFANSVSNYFSAIATFGITSYAIRTCAQIKSDKKGLHRTVGELFSANAATTLIAAIIYAAVVFAVPSFRAEWPYMLLFGIAFTSDFLGMNWFYTAMERFDYITARTVAFKFLSLALIFILVHRSTDGFIYVFITVFAIIGANLINFFYVRKLLQSPVCFCGGFQKHYTRTKWFFMQSIALTLFSNMDITMMGFESTSEQIGNYQVALKIKLLLSALVSSLGNIFLPRLSKNYKENNMAAYWGTVNKSLRYTTFISFPLIGIFWACADNVILLFCGSEYIYAGTILKVLVVAVLFIGLSTVTGIQVLLSMEKEKSLFMSLVAGTVVNFILNFLLIPRYHGVGAAITTVFAEFVVLVFQLICLRKNAIKLPLISIMKKPFLGAVFSFLAVFFLQKFVSLPLFFSLMLSCLLFAAVYLLVLFLLKEDILREIISILKRRSRHET